MDQSSGRKRTFQYLGLCVIVATALLAVTVLLSGIKAMSAEASAFKVGLITDQGSLGEISWGWLSYQGLLRSEADFDVIGKVYTSTDPSGIEPKIELCAQEGNDLCIGVGFYATDAISHSAGIYTNTRFAMIDGEYPSYTPNLRGTYFARDESGYLAGTLAGMMSQSDIIGALGGMELPTVIAFTEGFSNAAHCANPFITTIISYTGNFTDPVMGAQFAQGMIAQGADVVFAAAGQTGSGALLTATQSGVWAIGVDTDEYLSVFMSGTVPGSNYLLSSAMLRLDNATYSTISDLVSGNFYSGTASFDLSVDGVGLAPFHETESAIPFYVRNRLEWVKQAIIAEKIEPLDPNGPCLVIYQQYLPLTSR